MKTKKLIKKFYIAVALRKRKLQKKLWLKILKKSLKGKHTEVIQ